MSIAVMTLGRLLANRRRKLAAITLTFAACSSESTNSLPRGPMSSESIPHRRPSGGCHDLIGHQRGDVRQAETQGSCEDPERNEGVEDQTERLSIPELKTQFGCFEDRVVDAWDLRNKG